MAKLSVGDLFRIAGTSLLPLPALALPYNALDANSMALGGAGVAASHPVNAALMNPALLVEESDKISLQFPVIGARYRDPNNTLDDLDYYQAKHLEQDLLDAVDAFNEEATSANVAEIFSAAGEMWDKMRNFSKEPLYGEMFGGLSVAMPGKTSAKAFTINSWAIAGGRMNITDEDITLLEGLMTDAKGGTSQLANNDYIKEQHEKRIAEAAEEPDVDPATLKTVPEQLNSTMQVRGIAITELALAFAQEVDLWGFRFDAGVTPKYMMVTAIDYGEKIGEAQFVSRQNSRDYSNMNVDLGMAKHFGEGWRAGLALKNLIPQDYRAADGGQVQIRPQLRAGIVHRGDWHMVTADLDILENSAVGYEEDSRFLSLGGELELSDYVSLRAGYRYNFNNGDLAVPSVGLGMDFGVKIDLAVATTEDDIAAAFQLGYDF